MTLTRDSVLVGRSPKPTPNERAAWVRSVRIDTARMSQEAFASAIGVERPTISNWERGRYVPEWASIDKILKTFPKAPKPPFAVEPETSDPDRTVSPSHVTGGYTVQTSEGMFVAKRLDAVLKTLDDNTRYELMQECLAVIDRRAQRRPSERVAE